MCLSTYVRIYMGGWMNGCVRQRVFFGNFFIETFTPYQCSWSFVVVLTWYPEVSYFVHSYNWFRGSELGFGFKSLAITSIAFFTLFLGERTICHRSISFSSFVTFLFPSLVLFCGMKCRICGSDVDLESFWSTFNLWSFGSRVVVNLQTCKPEGVHGISGPRYRTDVFVRSEV